MLPDRHRRPAVFSLDYIRLPVCLSHYLYNVSMDTGGVLLGEDGALGDIATLLYVCFPLPTLLLYSWHSNCWTKAEKSTMKTLTDQLTKNTKKGYAKCWIFFMIVIA